MRGRQPPWHGAEEIGTCAHYYELRPMGIEKKTLVMLTCVLKYSARGGTAGCLGSSEPRMPVSEFQDASLEPGAKFYVLLRFYTTILTEFQNLACLALVWHNMAH